MNLQELVDKVDELEIIRHFDHESIEDKIECAKEEFQEFLEALDGNGDVAEEGIDVIVSVQMVFKRYGIDLEKAFLNKYNKDKLRV